MDKAQKDPKFQAQMQGAYTNLDNLKPYANYVNPFTVYLDGLFFMANAADASDLERAHKSLERVVGFDPDNNYVKQDLATVNDLINGKPLTPTTYVIFETGCAPVRDQIRIDIPIIVSKVSYVGAAFPTLKPQGNYLPSLTVTANSSSYRPRYRHDRHIDHEHNHTTPATPAAASSQRGHRRHEYDRQRHEHGNQRHRHNRHQHDQRRPMTQTLQRPALPQRAQR